MCILFNLESQIYGFKARNKGLLRTSLLRIYKFSDSFFILAIDRCKKKIVNIYFLLKTKYAFIRTRDYCKVWINMFFSLFSFHYTFLSCNIFQLL